MIEKEKGFWHRTKEVTENIWDGTKEITEDVWDGAKNVSEDIWEETKNVAGNVKDAFSSDRGEKLEKKSDCQDCCAENEVHAKICNGIENIYNHNIKH